MEIKNKRIADIIPYAANAKKHDKRQINNVAESIKQYGFVQPIVIDRDGVIVIGHCRALAAKKLGMQEVPCVCVDDLTPEQVNALRLVDNKSNESDWDYDLLADEIPGLDLSAFDFDWGLPEITEEVIEDEAPEVDEDAEPIAKLGDIWQLGRHRLMCGDSTDKGTVELLMDGKKADMVFTDPPYGISVVGNNGKVGADNLAKNGVYMTVKGDETTETTEKFFEVCKDLGFDKFVLWGGNYFVGFLPYSDGWIIWDKRGDMASNNFADGEMAWCSFHTPVRIYKQVWSGMIREGEHEKRVHPTQKPVKLLGEILKDFTDDDDIILDCFGGSGSTLIACEQIGRTCYMIEYEAHYVDVIIKRWETLTGEKAVLLNDDR